MSRLNISTNLDTLDNRAGLSGASQGKTIDEIQKELNKRVPLGKTAPIQGDSQSKITDKKIGERYGTFQGGVVGLHNGRPETMHRLNMMIKKEGGQHAYQPISHTPNETQLSHPINETQLYHKQA